MSREIAVALKELRRELSISQIQMAERLGLCNSTVCNWELGFSDPSPANCEIVLREFGLDLAPLREPLRRGVPCLEPDEEGWEVVTRMRNCRMQLKEVGWTRNGRVTLSQSLARVLGFEAEMYTTVKHNAQLKYIRIEANKNGIHKINAVSQTTIQGQHHTGMVYISLRGFKRKLDIRMVRCLVSKAEPGVLVFSYDNKGEKHA